MAAPEHGLYSTLHWEVGQSPAPRVHIAPGGYGDPERASLRVKSRTVEVYMSGTPDDLRAFAERVLVLADGLAESGDIEDGEAGDE